MDLTHLNNTSIELVRAVDGQNIRHAVLDFDGTLSHTRRLAECDGTNDG